VKQNRGRGPRIGYGISRRGGKKTKRQVHKGGPKEDFTVRKKSGENRGGEVVGLQLNDKGQRVFSRVEKSHHASQKKSGVTSVCRDKEENQRGQTKFHWCGFAAQNVKTWNAENRKKKQKKGKHDKLMTSTENQSRGVLVKRTVREQEKKVTRFKLWQAKNQGLLGGVTGGLGIQNSQKVGGVQKKVPNFRGRVTEKKSLKVGG